MSTKVYIELPLSGDDLTLEDAQELALFIEMALHQRGQVKGEYAGRTIGDATVYKCAEDLEADLADAKI